MRRVLATVESRQLQEVGLGLQREDGELQPRSAGTEKGMGLILFGRGGRTGQGGWVGSGCS